MALYAGLTLAQMFALVSSLRTGSQLEWGAKKESGQAKRAEHDLGKRRAPLL